MSDLDKLLKLIDESDLPIEHRWYDWDNVIDAVGILLIFACLVGIFVIIAF